ncbi:hypothetical protein C1646_775769 [Rhizophagus diaphanus]|nr:hypothetical protein C1646_775769 [Rhizophagus diaphanus] [Rhizophagus sp. MUCL 43196]
MEFVPFDNFKDVSFVAEGGFSKIYKAIWINGPITNWSEKKQKYNHRKNMTVALKELNNFKNLNSKELNEVLRGQKYTKASDIYYVGINDRPTVIDLYKIFERNGKLGYRREESNPTNITESPNIGPATVNNPDAIWL